MYNELTMKKIFGTVVIWVLFFGMGSVVFAQFEPELDEETQAQLDAAPNPTAYPNSTAPSGSTAPAKELNVSQKLTNPIRVNTFSEFAALVTATAVKVLMPFIVLAFIYSGFLFVRAQGNPKGIEEAKNTLWYSMIGAFVLLGAWGFAQIIGKTVSTITK